VYRPAVGRSTSKQNTHIQKRDRDTYIYTDQIGEIRPKLISRKLPQIQNEIGIGGGGAGGEQKIINVQKLDKRVYKGCDVF
jgi:hypothetical protein